MGKVWLLLIILILFSSFTYAVLGDITLIDAYDDVNSGEDQRIRTLPNSVNCMPMNITEAFNNEDLTLGLHVPSSLGGFSTHEINISIWTSTGNPAIPLAFVQQNLTMGADITTGADVYFNFSFPSITLSSGFHIWCAVSDNDDQSLQLKQDNAGTYNDAVISLGLSFTSDWVSWATLPAEDFNFRVWKTDGGLTPIFEPPTPTDGARNNTQTLINISCSTGNVTLYFDSDANPSTVVINNKSSPSDFTTSVSDGLFFYKASCTSGTINSSIRSWIFDTTEPTITLNSNNQFNKANFSLINQYNDFFNLSILFEDNFDLFGFKLNVSRLGTLFLNITNLTISGTSFTLTNITNISSWGSGIYNITIIVADSHTASSISDYDITTKDKEIIFNTAEGNRINIKSDLTASTTYKKSIDRYSFTYDFGGTLTPKKVFTLTSDKKIYYRPDSIYNAHFVVWNEEGGNWIDFEGASIASVKKVNDYEYTITFNNLNNKITFNSIGGLNTRNETFTWYRGLTNTTESSALPAFNTTITLNITNHTTISDISAELLYNGLKFTSPNITGFPDFALFEQNVTSATQNITYNWNVTVTQGDENTSDFLVSGLHTIMTFGLDNCSTFSEPAFTIFLRDEATNELVVGNGTFVFSYFADENPSDVRQLSLQMLGRDNFSFCKSDVSLNLIGDMSHSFSAPTYETRGFSRVDIPFTGNFSAFLLKSSATVQTVLFTLVDSSLSRIEGATMAFHRILGDTITNVAQGQSDFAGQVSTNLDSQITYLINITHPNFPLKTFNLKPVLSTYTIRLTTEGEILYQNAYEGFRYKIEPSGKLFNISADFVNFTFTVEGKDLEFWGINFTRHDFECLPASCQVISTSITGGSVTLGIKLNETGRFWTSLFFKRTGQDLVLINTWPNDATVFERATRSFIQLMQGIRDNTSENMLTVLTGLMLVVMIAIAVSFGIAGWPLAAFASLITIVLSLPNIGFINPFFGGFMAFAGLTMYAFSQRG